MHKASVEFADDPCSSMKRGSMTRAARNLLSAVTRLLIMADMVDVHLLLKTLQVVGGYPACPVSLARSPVPLANTNTVARPI